jgi:hypothetical protein
MPSINRLPSNNMYSLLDRALNFNAKMCVRVARVVGACHPPILGSLLRWADKKADQIQNRQRVMSQLETLYDKNKLYREFSEYKHQPLNKHQFKHISNFAEYVALKEGIKNSLEPENISFETQLAYATANSIVDAQAPLLAQKVIDTSKSFSDTLPDIIQKAEDPNNEKAKPLLTAIVEQVIREEIHKKGSSLSQPELESKAKLISERLSNPKDYASESFKKFKQTIHSESTINKITTVETLAALRELSRAFELKHFAKGEPFGAPENRLQYLTNQFNEILKADKTSCDPQNWIDALIQHPVIIQSWQLSGNKHFLPDVQEYIENAISTDASYQAYSSAGRDRILIESLLIALSNHVEPSKKREINQWMKNTFIADNKNAPNSVSQDFWEAMTNQVSKETNISIAALRDSMPDEIAQSIIRI